MIMLRPPRPFLDLFLKGLHVSFPKVNYATPPFYRDSTPGHTEVESVVNIGNVAE